MEILKFIGSVLGFCFACLGQILAQHSGAKKCLEEDTKAGEAKLFGTADGFGRKPQAADRRTYFAGAGVLALSLLFYFLFSPHVAIMFLIFSAIALGGVAIATWWAGCN